MATAAQLRREIEQLKQAYKVTRATLEPLIKIFHHDEGEDNTPEIEEYRRSHPGTRILNFIDADCGED
ncbi:hypothetical protein FTO70_14335 [Methanosarcina sp. KYL-1]|uniref:hypothetical protein n=1 Tax=Methanosarcina sp. KYL-1 TaxID=2602068 RepID=UPI002100C88C|nr:hypothetical protein [Methanosarcina sp. KYL-1]MCQ1536828.1 hypothetical protein [Methanosarcina sp. KYL-1]